MQVQRRQHNVPAQVDRYAQSVRGGLWHEPGERVEAPVPANSDDAQPPSILPSPIEQHSDRPQRLRKNRTPAKHVLSRNPILWGVLGFTLGVVFWHAIGFWGFVASVVLPQSGERDPSQQSQRIADPKESTQTPSRTISPARPTRPVQQQQQILIGKPAAATAPPRPDLPQPQMPLPGWGTTVTAAD